MLLGRFLAEGFERLVVGFAGGGIEGFHLVAQFETLDAVPVVVDRGEGTAVLGFNREKRFAIEEDDATVGLEFGFRFDCDIPGETATGEFLADYE